MAEYIEREAFAEDIRESYYKLQEIYETLRYERERDICNGELGTFCEILLRLKDFPAADVAPVVHGRWIPFEHWVHKTFWKGKACSVCNANIGHKTVFKFCPNCGARMDGE